MEKFVCSAGSDIQEIPEAVLERINVKTPVQLHLSSRAVEAAASEMEKGGWIRLPFCNTLCIEALGAEPVLSLSGARISRAPYRETGELPEKPELGTPRLGVMLRAVEELSAQGKKVAFSVDGPLSLLCGLLPMGRLFSALRRPGGEALLDKAAEWTMAYTCAAAESGAKLLSFADPIACIDILGRSMFAEKYAPCLKRLVCRMEKAYPHIPVHLCGKLSQSLLDAGECSVKIWQGEEGQNYAETLTSFCQGGNGGIIGHFCLNLLEAKRPYLELVEL